MREIVHIQAGQVSRKPLPGRAGADLLKPSSSPVSPLRSTPLFLMAAVRQPDWCQVLGGE
eukprot:1150910-Pelagomonas_calceolata.AAC.5